MQKSPKTSRLQHSYCVDYDRSVSLTRFAAAVRARPARQSLATVKWQTIVMQGRYGFT